MRLQLGINTVFAVKRWPRPADWAPIVRDRLQLRHVQLSLDLVDLDRGDDAIAVQAETIRDAVQAYGLKVHSTCTGLAAYSWNVLLSPVASDRHEARAWYARAITFTSAVGGLGTGGHVGAYSAADWHDLNRRAFLWSELNGTLGDLADLAHRAGQSFFMVENFGAPREPSSIEQLRSLTTEGDGEHVPVRPCIDVGHMCVPGAVGRDRDPYAWLRELGPVSPTVQVQQSDEEGDRHWPFTAARNRQGRIDADRVIDALEEGGVEETMLTIEVLPPFVQDDDDALSDLMETAAYWREALERRGAYAP